MTDSLVDLIFDLWWTTRPEADHLFRDLDPEVWEEVGHNPLRLLRRVRAEAAPAEWRRRAQRLLSSWHGTNADRPTSRGPAVAYFCMEFGLHACLPIYAGGLGVLAGDHVRSASDLGLDFRAVGLFYHQGFFEQVLADGRQVASYPEHPASELPIRPVTTADGAPLVIAVPYKGGELRARAWKVQVGGVRLYLLDTPVDGASEEARDVCRRLYGGDDRTRIAQEVLLGVGGVRLLEALGERPTVFHMNEGHSSFLLLELWAQGMKSGLDREAAWARARSQCVFTTHTPVPAGHDRFTPELVAEVLGGWEASIGLERGAFLDRGRFEGEHGVRLCMTTLALTGSRRQNAVSALHEQVSRQMWGSRGARIDHVTNGVHPTSWMAPELLALLDEHLDGWRQRFLDVAFWKGIERIPRDALVSTKRALRRALVSDLRRRSGLWILDDDALTLGFARRFATYKRATLLFQDPARLERILDRGVQLVFAGKAHPADQEGSAVLAEIVARTREPRFAGRVVFVPKYDLDLGRVLTQGADVWMNTPRRPREASGTSGQKAALNGTLNCSILDGWWPEAYDGTNGWAIGDETAPDDPAAQDRQDGDALYRVLEEQVLPAWDDPDAWAERMVRSMVTCIPRFNTHRMVTEYHERFYRS
jgi:glycogen phosphorylase